MNDCWRRNGSAGPLFHLGLAACVGVAILIIAGPAQAQWYVAPDLTFTDPDSDIYDDSDLGFGVSIGTHLFGPTDLEIGYSATRLPPRDAPGLIKRRQLTVNSVTSFPQNRAGTPYFSFGLGAARLDYLGDIDTAPVASAGLGYSVPLPLPGLKVQPEVRAVYTRNSDDFPKRNAVDGQAMVRVRYEPFAPTAAIAPPVVTRTPEAIVTTARPQTVTELCAGLSPGSTGYRDNRCDRLKDRDGDGVADGTDYCPNTIPGVRVDRDGCLLSS